MKARFLKSGFLLLILSVMSCNSSYHGSKLYFYTDQKMSDEAVLFIYGITNGGTDLENYTTNDIYFAVCTYPDKTAVTRLATDSWEKIEVKILSKGISQSAASKLQSLAIQSGGSSYTYRDVITGDARVIIIDTRKDGVLYR